MQENLRLIKEELAKREKVIEDYGYNSKERIFADEDIKTYIEDSELNFRELKRIIFADKIRLTPVEIDARGKQINLLRKNLNILTKQFNNSRKVVEERRRTTQRRQLLEGKRCKND